MQCSEGGDCKDKFQFKKWLNETSLQASCLVNNTIIFAHVLVIRVRGDRGLAGSGTNQWPGSRLSDTHLNQTAGSEDTAAGRRSKSCLGARSRSRAAPEGKIPLWCPGFYRRRGHQSMTAWTSPDRVSSSSSWFDRHPSMCSSSWGCVPERAGWCFGASHIVTSRELPKRSHNTSPRDLFSYQVFCLDTYKWHTSHIKISPVICIFHLGLPSIGVNLYTFRVALGPRNVRLVPPPPNGALGPRSFYLLLALHIHGGDGAPYKCPAPLLSHYWMPEVEWNCARKRLKVVKKLV